MTYAFLERCLGPEDTRGVMLYRITDAWETPSIAWWPSAADYFQGREGIDAFDGVTRDSVEVEYPDIVVFHDRKSAMQAWQIAHAYRDVMRLYCQAINELHRDFSYEDYDLNRHNLTRGRHWLFGASMVTQDEQSRFAFLASKVFR